MTVAEADGAKVPKLAAPKAEAPAPAEVIEEPVKRSSKKEEPVADKKDLSKVLSDWDDE
jgi:hypothetical protein